MRLIDDGISISEAADILDCAPRRVRRLVDDGELEADAEERVSREAVEQLAASRWRTRAQRRKDPDSYFVTGQEAAEVLGVSRPRLDQLARAGALPYMLSRQGVRLYRRDQLATIGNARLSRRSAANGRAQR